MKFRFMGMDVVVKESKKLTTTMTINKLGIELCEEEDDGCVCAKIEGHDVYPGDHIPRKLMEFIEDAVAQGHLIYKEKESRLEAKKKHKRAVDFDAVNARLP